jgi:transcriptional regulator with XRE-family HTH domain
MSMPMPMPIRGAGKDEQVAFLGRPPKTRLSEVLRKYRLQARLSQRDLARISEISWTMIQILERGSRSSGKPVHPSPTTLRQLAHGLAYDPFTEQFMSSREEEIYAEFMQAAEYLPDSGERSVAMDARQIGQALLRLFEDDPATGETLARLVLQMRNLSLDDRAFLARSIAINLDGMQRR